MALDATLSDPAWSTALPDWKERILCGKSLVPDLPLFDEVAEKALRIFKRLRVPDVIGNPTYGDACKQWVFDFVRAVFGSYDPETKRRMIREFFLLVPKKNGKSSIAAAIIVTAAIMNERPEAELLLIAPTKTIADISFKQALGIVKLDAELMKMFHAQEHLKKLTHRVSNAVIVIKAADTDAITGAKSTFTLIDETHEFATKSKAAAVFLELRGALAARPDGFLLQITTQSKEPPSGVFKAELDNARAVRDGEIVLPILAVLYELPIEAAENGGWKDRKTWGLVNPNLNVSVDEAFHADQLITAERAGPAAMALLASQHFNVEVGIGLKANTWVGAKFWLPATAPDPWLSLETMLDRCEVAVAGIDGGGLDDLFGLAVIGRETGSKDWLHWGHAWAHPEVLEQRKDIAPKLLDFEQDGDLTICSYATQDLEEVAQLIGLINDRGLMPEAAAVGLDPAGVASLVDELAAIGISAEQMVAIGQGYRLSSAIWGLERKLKDKTLLHAGRPMMSWVLSNAKSEQRGSAVIITKEAAGKAKIDPLVATFNAVMLMSRNPQAKPMMNISKFLSNPVMVA